jgi:D-alanyl-D-alanine carboxypeptidase
MDQKLSTLVMPAAISLALLFSGCATSQSEPNAHASWQKLRESPISQEALILPEPGYWKEQSLKDPHAARLDTAFKMALPRLEAEAVSAAVFLPRKGIWVSVPTVATAEAHPFASVSKAVATTIVHQLALEGSLSLSNSAADLLPELDLDPVITINHLLTHTSGLPTLGELDSPGARLFPPGEGWNYSNLGFQLLDQIIEQVTGYRYTEVVQIRIANPLGLQTFRAVDEQESPIAQAGAAGNLVATAPDMLRFWYALLSGELLPRDQVRSLMNPLYPSPDERLWFGAGIMVYRLPGPKGGERLWLGHSGGIPGHQAAVAWSPDARALAAVAIRGKGSAESVINQLFSVFTDSESTKKDETHPGSRQVGRAGIKGEATAMPVVSPGF